MEHCIAGSAYCRCGPLVERVRVLRPGGVPLVRLRSRRLVRDHLTWKARAVERAFTYRISLEHSRLAFMDLGFLQAFQVGVAAMILDAVTGASAGGPRLLPIRGPWAARIAHIWRWATATATAVCRPEN